MGWFFKSAKTLKKFWNSLSEAVPYINNKYSSENGILYLCKNDPDRIFFHEGNTIYLGFNLSISIQGDAVSFWVGLNISNRTVKGEVALYFDKPSNSPNVIDKLNGHKNWQHSKKFKVKDGYRLVYKKGIDLKSDDWYDFINEPISVLLE